jgi:hypothetical protein
MGRGRPLKTKVFPCFGRLSPFPCVEKLAALVESKHLPLWIGKELGGNVRPKGPVSMEPFGFLRPLVLLGHPTGREARQSKGLSCLRVFANISFARMGRRRHLEGWDFPCRHFSRLFPCLVPAIMGLVGIILCTFVVGAAAGQTQWAEIRQIGPFFCYAEFPLTDVPQIPRMLAQLEVDLIRALGVQPQPTAVELYLFSEERSYRGFVSMFYPDVPYRRALYIRRDGRPVVLAYRSEHLEIDLRHECAHALVHSWLPYVPLWLDEGLAEYFEQPPARRAFGHPHLKIVRLQAFFGRNPSLERLENITAMEAMGEKEYRASWAWVHYLLHGPAEVNEEFRLFLRTIQAGGLSPPLSVRLRNRVPKLDENFRQHFRSWHP